MGPREQFGKQGPQGRCRIGGCEAGEAGTRGPAAGAGAGAGEEEQYLDECSLRHLQGSPRRCAGREVDGSRGQRSGLRRRKPGRLRRQAGERVSLRVGDPGETSSGRGGEQSAQSARGGGGELAQSGRWKQSLAQKPRGRGDFNCAEGRCEAQLESSWQHGVSHNPSQSRVRDGRGRSTERNRVKSDHQDAGSVGARSWAAWL